MKSRKKIFIDCRQYGESGIGTYIESLIDNFHGNSDFDFNILIRNVHKNDFENKSNFYIKQYNDSLYGFKEQISWILKINPFGILHVPHYNAPLLYPGKLIVTVHDVCHRAMSQYFPGISKRIYSTLFFKSVLHRANHIITVSQFSKNEIVKYFKIKKEKITVIYNGVSDKYKYINEDISKLVTKKYNLPEEYILFLGNIKPHKNIQGTLQSYIKAVEIEKDLPPLVLLGQNSRMLETIPNIKELVNNEIVKKRVIFTGYLPASILPAVYSQALFFLMPSFYEGFGLTLLESMACDTPVITSNRSAIPEIVGNAALLVDPYNNGEITDSIIRLTNDADLRRDLIQRGRERIKKFTWEKSAIDHLLIYKKLSKVESPPKKSVTSNKNIRKKNVLFMDQYGDRIGGGQVILLDILLKLRMEENWRLFISVPKEGAFVDLLEKNGFSPLIIRGWQPKNSQNLGLLDIIRYIFDSINSSYNFGKIIKKYNIDLIYCNGGRTFLNGVFLSILFPLKVIYHLHLVLGEQQKKAVVILGKIPTVKAVFAVSNLLKKQYKGYSIERKIQVISNWVSPDLVLKKNIPRNNKLTGTVRVGIVGQISRIKGQLAVLESMLHHSSVLPITLSIFGEPLDEEEEHWTKIQMTIDSLNKKGWDIRYEGFESNKLKLYDNLDILIIPSYAVEAFGLTAIEAMAREVIVVSNQTGALVEIIEHGENGFLYNAQSPDELMPILTNLVNNCFDIEKIRINGLKTVNTNFHPDKQLALLQKSIDGSLSK